jgi:hypothetical protein
MTALLRPKRRREFSDAYAQLKSFGVLSEGCDGSTQITDIGKEIAETLHIQPE